MEIDTEQTTVSLEKQLGFATTTKEYAAKAVELADQGKALEFVASTIGKFHRGDTELVQLIWLSTLGIYQPYKVHWLLVGQPGSGKSNLSRSVLKTIPEAHKEEFDSASPKAIFYAGDGGLNLSGRTLFFDEVASDMILLLKALGTDGREALKHITVDDHRKFKELIVPEEIQVIATTVQSLADQQGQMLRRYLIVNPDESEEALKAACDMIQDDARLIPALTRKEVDREIEIAKQIYQKVMSENVNVVIPYRFEFGALRLSDKTEIKAFITLVKCHALLNYPNRVRIGSVILATPEDLEKVSKLWYGNVRENKIDAIAEQILNFLPVFDPIFIDEEIQDGPTTTNIANELGIPPRTVGDKLKHLYEMGYTDRRKLQKGRGQPYINWRVDGGKGEPKIITLQEDGYEEEVKNVIKTILKEEAKLDKIGEQEVENFFNEYCASGLLCNNKTGRVEQSDNEIERLYTPPRDVAEDTSFDGNEGMSEEIDEVITQPKRCHAPRNTEASTPKQGNESSLYNISAEEEVKEESILDNSNRNTSGRDLKEIPHTGTEGIEYVCSGCGAPFPSSEKLAAHYPYCCKYQEMQTKEAKEKQEERAP